MTPVKKINWAEVKTEYLKGKKTYRQLAQQYNVSLRTIAYHAKREKWVEEYQQIVSKAVEKTAKRQATKKADRMQRMYRICEKLQGSLEMVADSISETPQNALLAIKEINGLTRAAQNLTDLIRDIYGLPGEQAKQGRERLRIDRERLRMEQERNNTSAGEGLELLIVRPDEVEEHETTEA